MLNPKNYDPAIMYGAKITADQIAGMIGLPYVGKILYIDPTNGNDTSNAGESQNDALKTLTTSEGKMTNYAHDVAIIVPGGTSGTSEVAGITWDKHYAHVIGNTAPVAVSQRSRIVFTTDATDPCLTISGNGNIFKNVQVATYQDSNDVLVSLTGNRNYFGGVHFAGIGSATAGDDTSARCLSLSGAEENLFEGCTVGLDSVARSDANANLELASGSARNIFRSTRFIAFADNAGALFVKAASSADIDRFVEFEDCMFINGIASSGTTMTVGMSIHAAVGGLVMLTGTTNMVGATDLADDFTAVYVSAVGDTTAATAALMVNAA